MSPSYLDASRDGKHSPGLDEFVAIMRSVLRTRPGSPVDGPEALESWSRADGYVWRWSTPHGLWRVDVGGVVDPRPLLHGPDGIWRVDAPPCEHAGDLVLLLLRVAGAIPAAVTAVDPTRQVAVRPGRAAVVHGERHAAPPPVYAPNSGDRWAAAPRATVPETVGTSAYRLG